MFKLPFHHVPLNFPQLYSLVLPVFSLCASLVVRRLLYLFFPVCMLFLVLSGLCLYYVLLLPVLVCRSFVLCALCWFCFLCLVSVIQSSCPISSCRTAVCIYRLCFTLSFVASLFVFLEVVCAFPHVPFVIKALLILAFVPALILEFCMHLCWTGRQFHILTSQIFCK